jgi:hypothetical protein
LSTGTDIEMRAQPRSMASKGSVDRKGFNKLVNKGKDVSNTNSIIGTIVAAANKADVEVGKDWA